MRKPPEDRVADNLRNALEDHLNSNQDKPKSSLFHYTSYEGLKGILSSKYLRMTRHRDLNDPSEIEHGFKIIKEAIQHFILNDSYILERQKNHISVFIENVRSGYKAYITSFCLKKDYLPAWRYYSSNCAGYSIGFKKEMFIPKPQPTSNDRYLIFELVYEIRKSNNFLEPMFNIFKKHYDQTDGSGYIKMFTILFSHLFTVLPKFKNPDFKDEHEWRFSKIYIENPDGEIIPEPIPIDKMSEEPYSNKKNIPHLSGTITTKHYLNNIIKFEYFDIESIYVAPRLDFKKAKTDIINILKCNGASEEEIASIKILKSEKAYQ